MLIRYNAWPPHTTTTTQHLHKTFGWEQSDNLQYNLDPAPSGYHLFQHTKSFVDGQRFNDNNQVKEVVNMYFISTEATFYNKGKQWLVPCHKKCFNIDGNYVEKYFKVCTLNSNNYNFFRSIFSKKRIAYPSTH